ncbi:uncharacterized protein KIAA0825 homolog [Eublepharis macularius]|uniref:Uncharacterized protein KIAA0825 homolog n=1 Tax=Eublepharis macularius TaxID=481883 RepID=A0AA97L6G4_EUBMA|nr:uncharacterized protein KIAA0825 homolog [Eublepharis macularius]
MEWGGEYTLESSNLDCLLNTLPGDPEFHQVLEDIDEKLKKNASSVEQCLKELQSEINQTCSDELLQDTADCLQWLRNCSFSSVKPCSTPHGQLVKFLQALQSLLKSEENQEELILHFLLDLSSQCGVIFPCTPSGTSFEFTSNISLHGIEDDSAADIHCIWNDVRLHLRRFLVNQLQSLHETKIGTLQQQLQFKTQCLQQLLFLYPESEVIAKYQNIQNKLVSNLLRKCVPESSGEINLEKVVRDYESSISTLCTMIKEDLYILSGIFDPSTTLKFINESYLDTITEEVTILLKKNCQPPFKENALYGIKTSKKQKGVAQGWVSEEYPGKERNFSLTINQLRCLSYLVKFLLVMEEKVEELALPSFTKNKNVQGVMKKADGDLLIGESKANGASVLLELQVKESTILSFGWRNTFKDLSSTVACCITIAVEDFSTEILQHEQKEQSSSSSYVINLVTVQCMKKYWGVFHEKEQPKQISKFCSDILEELDTLLPLALACRDESLQEIRSNFVEASCKIATAVLERLEERIKDVPSRAPIQNLYAILSTAVHVYQHFKIYHNLMKEKSRKPLFLVPLQQYQELISVLQFQVKNYCIRVCATSILQDAESHYWDDYKAFYEGERCSFSVQMWHYFCCALHHDLWTVLPPVLAQEILTEVLEESLAILTNRYFQAHTSYKRTSQIRIDATAILMTCENMLWSICGSVQELLSPHQDKNPYIYKIHKHCNGLLTTAVILTVPMKNLYEAFLSGFDDSFPSLLLQPPFNQPLHWLSSITEFPPFLKTPSAREMAAWGQLRLLLSQPYCNWNLLLETLLHHDCLLVKILLRSSKSELFKCGEQSTCLDEKNSEEPSLTEAIFTVLSYCTLSPKSLGVVLENFMEKEKMWDCLYNMSVSSCGESEPEIIRCLKMTLMNSVKGIVKQIISLMHSWEATENYGTYQHKQIVPESLLKTVPKEWNYTPREMKRKESGKCFTRLAAQAVSIVISKLPTVIACLPPPIKYFFFLSERKMPKTCVELKKAGLLVWILIVIICRIFEDGNITELLIGTTLDRWSKEKLSLIRICLESIMGEKKSSPKQVTQKIIWSIEQQRPNWIENQLLKAKKLSIDCTVIAAEDGRSLGEEAIEFELTEQKINMMVLDICHKPGGSEYLRQIYHIIQLNEEYLNEQLSHEELSEENMANIRPLNLTLRSKEQQPIFDPFQVHYWYCTNVLKKCTITEWKWDWTNFLLSCPRLNKMTLKTLLMHRWEMKEGEVLEEEEKVMVEHLKNLCLIPTPPSSENKIEHRT